jgi:3'-phosphoadenosine 5'-phosphosulfate sulfotransferase (PAPS reductase)/FAD synthetase
MNLKSLGSQSRRGSMSDSHTPISKTSLVIFGNYGNPTLALMQWVYSKPLPSNSLITCVSIDTGWHAEAWLTHIAKAEAYARSLKFRIVRLKANPNFSDLVRERQAFPSTQFQWCAGFLKGLPFIEWLDAEDPRNEAIIVLGKRRADSPTLFDLPEWVENSEHFGGRKIWHPLYKTDDLAFRDLVTQTGIEFLQTRSLECEPCIHNQPHEFSRLSEKDIQRIHLLEEQVGTSFYSIPITHYIENITQEHALQNTANPLNYAITPSLYMGCGSPFGCGE